MGTQVDNVLVEDIQDVNWLREQTAKWLREQTAKRRKKTEKKEISIIVTKGGPGSGHHGHAGRPGKVGGSQPGKRSSGISITPGGQIDFGRGRIPSTEKLNEVIRSAEQSMDYSDPALDTFLNDGLSTQWGAAGFTVRGEVKSEIVGRLAKDTGIPEEAVNEFIGQWAQSSNDEDMRSLAIQKDAAEELGVSLDDWQQERIAELDGMGEEAFYEWAELEADRMGWGASQMTDEDWEGLTWDAIRSGEYQKDNPDAWEYIQESASDMEGLEEEVAAMVQSAPLMDSASQRKLIRAMYNYTQERFQEAGYGPGDTITLFRGFVPEMEMSDFAEALDESEGDIEWEGNPLESWSASYAVAAMFGNVQIAMEVPIRNIIASARTGFGCLTEGEFVITNPTVGEAFVMFYDDILEEYGPGPPI